ncbi:hypothetical protein [Kribbella sindirgiensis]|uniref:Uncharacterized protein n=1 Tax=Kribbella sindirgiensis TaxID=1124744 RepID=A0A4R0I119_9ACTN|nr:hypothetical protein [Kribbella sindirgiensis]TCC15875.1 hypothetical protein E0H50_41280 [Kribbella sindirgiensis]
MNEEIRRQLREAAEAHEPNRARILARVERGVADPSLRPRTPSIARSWPRAAVVAVIAAATLATGGLAAAVAAIGGAPTPPATAPTHTVPSPTATSPTATSAPTPSTRTTTTGPAPTTTSRSARPTPPADSRVKDGPLWSEGSLDVHSSIYWAQSNLILKTTEPLTSLTVELRIAQTGGVRSTGNWQTLPSDDFTVTVQESGDVLLYRWALKPGRTVPTGQHQFAGQYNHATGIRKVKHDSYRAHAQSSGRSAAVWGGFAPPR